MRDGRDARGQPGREPGRELGVGLRRLARAQGAARSVLGQGVAGDDEIAVAELRVERPAGADPDGPPHAELGELLQDDRGARAAHAGRLDAERAALRRLPGVSPEPAGVVAHLGLGEQLLGVGQGAAGVAGQQDVRRVGRARPEVVRHAASIWAACGGSAGSHEAASAREALRGAALGDRADLRGDGWLGGGARGIAPSSCSTRWRSADGRSGTSSAGSSPPYAAGGRVDLRLRLR